MNTASILPLLLCALAAGTATAYPPAPFHRIYGTVRDDHGTPLGDKTGAVILTGTGNVEIVRGISDPSIGPNINYSVNVSMDSGTTSSLYQITALRPLLPFTVRVIIGGVSYVPIQAIGGSFNIGAAGGQTRIDLTVGVDSDGDGLPDGWEYDLIDSDLTGTLLSLADIRPGDDLDGDGLTNLDEYLTGTYALDALDHLALEVVGVSDGYARLRFVAIGNHTYSLKSSAGTLQGYTDQPFSLAASGKSIQSYLAPEIETRDIFVNVQTAPQMFFRLQVQ